MINKIRKLLIHIGKVLPFVVCFLMCINYLETAFALATSDYLHYDGVVILNTPISFFIGQYFEYNLQMLAVLVIISIAIETCIYNKLACAYLGVNLAEKSYFDFELEPTAIYIICLANIIVAGCLTIKGIKILIQHE
jgi:hypothetical protein